LLGVIITMIAAQSVNGADPVRALRARMAIVVDTTAEAVRIGYLDERRRRRMRARSIRLNETALLIQDQIEDKANPAMLWPGVTGEQLTPWLFDAELAVEWVSTAGRRFAVLDADTVSEDPTAIPNATRGELVAALTQLSRALRVPQPGGLQQAADRAQRILDQQPRPTSADDPSRADVRRLALAIINAAKATADVRAIVEGAAPVSTDAAPAPASDGDGQQAENRVAVCGRVPADAFMSAAAQTRRNIDTLVAIIDGDCAATVNSATDELGAAETLARHQASEEPEPDTRRFLTAVHALRQIEGSVITAATNLGARDSVKVPRLAFP
jgi:hypothetical protein